MVKSLQHAEDEFGVVFLDCVLQRTRPQRLLAVLWQTSDQLLCVKHSEYCGEWGLGCSNMGPWLWVPVLGIGMGSSVSRRPGLRRSSSDHNEPGLRFRFWGVHVLQQACGKIGCPSAGKDTCHRRMLRRSTGQWLDKERETFWGLTEEPYSVLILIMF